MADEKKEAVIHVKNNGIRHRMYNPAKGTFAIDAGEVRPLPVAVAHELLVDHEDFSIERIEGDAGDFKAGVEKARKAKADAMKARAAIIAKEQKDADEADKRTATSRSEV